MKMTPPRPEILRLLDFDNNRIVVAHAADLRNAHRPDLQSTNENVVKGNGGIVPAARVRNSR